ncbi:hypothetical protein [Streptomyces cinereoruber]|uniref:hypothetical protein n=1 Tax=Streptomyces cinereoruber TaxID=67260 RepID=UPI003641F451
MGTAHAYVHAVVALLAERAPGLTMALRAADARYVLPDGTLADRKIVRLEFLTPFDLPDSVTASVTVAPTARASTVGTA